MKKAWYILNYHDINWELGPINFGIGGTFSPDMFAEHLTYLCNEFEFVTIDEGLNRTLNNNINSPMLSFWFDDGLVGVRKYGFDILESYNAKGAISINSNFLIRKEMFWRFKLSYISSTDGLKVLRSRLRKYGYSFKYNVKDFTLNNFSNDILNVINLTYKEYAPEYFRKDAFRIFDTIEGIKFLHENGWTIANHSAAHYPITEQSGISQLSEEFKKCEKSIKENFNIDTPFWVSPFDRVHYRAERLFEIFNNINDGSKYLVMVGNRINYDISNNIIYRLDIGDKNGREISRFLKKK